MVKSRAEIQREYRQRLKEKNNSDYLRRERDRKNRSNVPSSSLSENDREERNRRNRQNLQRYYQKKRAERARNSTQETSRYESDEHDTTNERGRMLVRMDFSNRDSGKRKGALKRWKRDKSLATTHVRMLEQEKDKLFIKYRPTQRSLQRLKVRLNTGQANAEMTPNKETEKEMKDAKLDKFQGEKLKKSLLFGHVLAKEIKETKKATPMSKLKALQRVVSGKIVKKYKIIKHLSDKTGLCRHQLSRSITKNHQIRTSRRKVLKPVKGTMKIHAVIGQGSSKILTRDVSCYCEDSIRGNMCDTWRAAKTQDTVVIEGEVDHSSEHVQ
ncbi:hypothetical protein MAR_037944, partial [Mya arenaria]